MATNQGQIGKIWMKNSREVEWSIENFCSYTVKDHYYQSSSFNISGSQWHLRVFPNGQTAEDCVGWISLSLINSCYGTVPISARCIFGLKKVDGTVEFMGSRRAWVFESDLIGCGCPRFLERSELQQRRSELLASETFTLICTLWTGRHFEPIGCLHTLSRNFAALFLSKRGCDATVKVMDAEFPVHRLILSARSPVLAATFEADMKEKRTGLVQIEDCDPETFKEFLTFLYSGEVDNIYCNAFELYKIADKYDVQDLKSECLISIMKNLSVENVLEAAVLGNQFNESDLMVKIHKFFKNHNQEIISSSKWDEIIFGENVTVANNLLKAMVKK